VITGIRGLEVPGECRVSLDALLADPRTVVGQMSPDQAAALLGRLASVQALLEACVATRAVATGAEQPSSPAAGPSAPASAWSEADLLTAKEAAALLRVSRRWFYRHAPTLPFARKLSPKVLRFSRSGLTRWLATRRYE
jgi:predicted DNA-binding transcriptional regulator AlpA